MRATGGGVLTALSIVAPAGAHIAAGLKTLEVRRWAPPAWPLRDLLIVENRRYLSADQPRDEDGRAVAIVVKGGGGGKPRSLCFLFRL